MAFGDSINALLETYSNCISLLKAFKHKNDNNNGSGSNNRNNKTGLQKAQLRRSLRSDRSLVESAYSSRLSKSGSRFEKGDARAVSSLDRVLRKLRGAIANLLHLSGSKKRGPVLDYDSLRSLSNSSRAEAIQAIDHLSRRLATHSRASVASSSSSKSSSARQPGPISKKQSTPFVPAAPVAKKNQITVLSEGSSKKTSASSNQKRKEKKDKQHAVDHEEKAASPPLSPIAESLDQPPSRPPLSKTPPVPNRMSLMSFSSDSTKLGEIPERKWRQRSRFNQSDGDSNSDGYNVSPLYPLKPYTTEVKGQKRFWIFSRR